MGGTTMVAMEAMEVAAVVERTTATIATTTTTVVMGMVAAAVEEIMEATAAAQMPQQVHLFSRSVRSFTKLLMSNSRLWQ